MDFIKVVEKLLPPMSPLQTWRVIVVILLGALGVHAAWAIGWIPGLDGFAQQAQVRHIEDKIEQNRVVYTQSIEEVQATQSSILVRLIAADVERAREAQCKALTERNTGAAQGWRVRLDSSLFEFRVQAGRDYVLRPCDEY